MTGPLLRDRLALTLLASLALGCLSGPLIGQATRPQSKPTAKKTDWIAMVRKAHTHRRMMIRRAAARKVARAGDAAVPAVRAFQKQHGRDRLSLDLVTEYQRAATRGEATLALLEHWAADVDFYWRSQALGALANRRLPRYADRFRAGLSDPAFLTRIQSGRGLCLLGVEGDKVLALLADEDPRVRLQIAVCLVEQKDLRGLPTLVEALRQEASFLDYPWGGLGAIRAFKLLKQTAGEDFGYRVGESVATNEAAIAAFDKYAQRTLGESYRAARRSPADAADYAGGIEIRSCRNGDVFLRWTAQREIVFGLEPGRRVKLDAKRFAAFLAKMPGKGKGIRGKVVCDYLRVMCQNPQLNQKSAPGALPLATSDWLDHLARLLAESDARDLSSQISSRLAQFKPRRNQ